MKQTECDLGGRRGSALGRARKVALGQRTSVNQLVREYLSALGEPALFERGSAGCTPWLAPLGCCSPWQDLPLILTSRKSIRVSRFGPRAARSCGPPSSLHACNSLHTYPRTRLAASPSVRRPPPHRHRHLRSPPRPRSAPRSACFRTGMHSAVPAARSYFDQGVYNRATRLRSSIPGPSREFEVLVC
jgi:hypothetical protein